MKEESALARFFSRDSCLRRQGEEKHGVDCSVVLIFPPCPCVPWKCYCVRHLERDSKVTKLRKLSSKEMKKYNTMCCIFKFKSSSLSFQAYSIVSLHAVFQTKNIPQTLSSESFPPPVGSLFLFFGFLLFLSLSPLLDLSLAQQHPRDTIAQQIKEHFPRKQGHSRDRCDHRTPQLIRGAISDI